MTQDNHLRWLSAFFGFLIVIISICTLSVLPFSNNNLLIMFAFSLFNIGITNISIGISDIYQKLLNAKKNK